MKTGDVIYTKIAKMGNKVRPCIAICGNSLKELFLIPISSKDWNTLSTVSISFKDRQGTAVLNEAFIGTVSNNQISQWSISSCLLYTSPSPRDRTRSRMPSSA